MSESVYSFEDARREIRIHRPDLAQPWINYLSNGRMHAFASQAAGGLAWWRSPLVFRLTRYRFHHLPVDSPGFGVYLSTPDDVPWSPSWRPAETPLDKFETVHKPGRSIFRGERKGLAATLELFVAPSCDALIWDLRLETTQNQSPVDVNVFAAVELSLMAWRGENEWGQYIKHNLSVRYDRALGAVVYLWHHDHSPCFRESPLVVFASDQRVRSFDADRDAFVGAYRTERDPAAVDRGECSNSQIDCGEPMAALQTKVRVAPHEPASLRFFLVAAGQPIQNYPEALREASEIVETLREPARVQEERERLDAWWDEHLSAMQAELPDPDAARQINTWTPVQCVHTARYSRSISSSAPGIRGIGFRDTAQDMLAIAYRDPAWASREFMQLLRHQFADGHAVHTLYPVEGLPPVTSVHSDDHLWLPLLAYAILAETGDLGMLDIETPFLGEDGASPGEAGSVWDHLMAAVSFTESHLGQHDLPLTLKSDWNDIIGKFAREGRGESVFAGMQYVVALRQLMEIAEAAGKSDDLVRLNDCLVRMVRALETHAWDGEWWRRGFDDDGQAVGAVDRPFGKLFLNPQSWAVLAGLGPAERLVRGMDAVASRLNTGLGLAILWPSFRTWPEVSDPFSGYSPGCGENGAVFCHANTWAIIAEAKLGRADKAWDYFNQLVPHVACQKVGPDRYRAEPYAYVSNIVGPDNDRFGWANVTQVSGTAAWMDVAGTQHLLGVRPTLAGLRVDPRLPSGWTGCTIRRRYRGCELEIEVAKPPTEANRVVQLTLDGESWEPSGGLGPVLEPARLRDRSHARVRVELTA